MSIYHKLALDPYRFVQIRLSSTCTGSGNILYLHLSLSMLRCQVSCRKLRQIMYMKFDKSTSKLEPMTIFVFQNLYQLTYNYSCTVHTFFN